MKQFPLIFGKNKDAKDEITIASGNDPDNAYANWRKEYQFLDYRGMVHKELEDSYDLQEILKEHKETFFIQ